MSQQQQLGAPTIRPMTTSDQRARFGAKVRRYREARGWSQLALSSRLDVTASAVAQWEQGRGGAREEHVQALEVLFELDPGTLGADLGHAPSPVTQPPEDAIESAEWIPDEHKRTLLAHLAEVRRIANEQR